jgi:hypothetical protein
MCTGASLLYKIPQIVIGATRITVDGQTWYDPTAQIEYLRKRNTQLVFARETDSLYDVFCTCENMMVNFLSTSTGLTMWKEDIAI